MPTTVHLPDALLKSVDRRAQALGISRNRLVVRALEQAVSVRTGWTPKFLERLRDDRRFVIDDVGVTLLVTAAIGLGWTRDPFDRLLAAHSAARRLRLCTVDPVIQEHHALLVRELAVS